MSGYGSVHPRATPLTAQRPGTGPFTGDLEAWSQYMEASRWVYLSWLTSLWQGQLDLQAMSRSQLQEVMERSKFQKSPWDVSASSELRSSFVDDGTLGLLQLDPVWSDPRPQDPLVQIHKEQGTNVIPSPASRPQHHPDSGLHRNRLEDSQNPGSRGLTSDHLERTGIQVRGSTPEVMHAASSGSPVHSHVVWSPQPMRPPDLTTSGSTTLNVR